MKRLKINVYGRVQGVYYRASTERYCREHSISGFVRNEKDGSVYLEAESDESRLEQLLLWLKKGPPMAKVTEVRSEEIPTTGKLGFEITRL